MKNKFGKKANQADSTKATDDRLEGMEDFKKIQAQKAKAGDCMFC